MFRATVRGREPMVLGWSTTSSTRPCLESLPSIVRMAFSSCFNGLSYRVFPSWSRACAWCALLPTSRPTHTSMSSGVIIVPPVMKVFRSPRARRSPDARAAPTLRRDLRHAPLKRPCSRPGSYQRSSGVPVPGDNTPRIIDDRAGKSYRNRRPGPDHRGLPNMVMGGALGVDLRQWVWDATRVLPIFAWRPTAPRVMAVTGVAGMASFRGFQFECVGWGKM